MHSRRSNRCCLCNLTAEFSKHSSADKFVALELQFAQLERAQEAMGVRQQRARALESLSQQPQARFAVKSVAHGPRSLKTCAPDSIPLEHRSAALTRAEASVLERSKRVGKAERQELEELNQAGREFAKSEGQKGPLEVDESLVEGHELGDLLDDETAVYGKVGQPKRRPKVGGRGGRGAGRGSNVEREWDTDADSEDESQEEVDEDE